MSVLLRASDGVSWVLELIAFAVACTIIVPAVGILKVCRAVRKKIGR